MCGVFDVDELQWLQVSKMLVFNMIIVFCSKMGWQGIILMGSSVGVLVMVDGKKMLLGV